MGVLKALRHQHGQGLSQNFFGAVAEQSLRPRIPEPDETIGIRGDNRVVRRLGDAAQHGFAVLQRTRDLRRHRIERTCEPTQFVLATHLHSALQVAGGDRLGGSGDLTER